VSKSELSPTGKKKIFVSRPANANRRGGWHGKYIPIMWHSFLFPQGKAVFPQSGISIRPSSRRSRHDPKAAVFLRPRRAFVAQQCNRRAGGFLPTASSSPSATIVSKDARQFAEKEAGPSLRIEFGVPV
jgi:hypothetical protein